MLQGGGRYLNDVFEMSDVVINNFYVANTLVYKVSVTAGTATYSIVSDYWPSIAVNTHADIRNIAIRSNLLNEEVLFGCDGGIIKTTNQGVSWTCINGTGMNISQFYSVSSFNKNNNLIVTPQDNWIKLKTGSSWQTVNATYNQSASEACWSEVNYINDEIVYYNEWNDILKSTDGGLNSASTSNPIVGMELGQRFYLDPTNPDVVWSGSSFTPHLYKYTSTGTVTNSGAWVIKTAPTGTDITTVHAIAVAPTNSNIIIKTHADPAWNFTVSNTLSQHHGKVYKSVNAGSSWIDITMNLYPACFGAGATHVVFDPLNENRIFISFGAMGSVYLQPTVAAFRVMYSDDGGVTWTDISNGLTPLPVNHIAYQSGTDDVIYAATDMGVWRYNRSLVKTTPTGTVGTWECFNQGLPPVVVRKVDINYCRKKLFVATYGRGVYSCDLPATPVFKLTPASVNLINGTSATNPTLTLPAYYNQAFANDVIVDAGVFLKQQGIMSFNPAHALVVAKKSHVVLTGTMTTYCPQLWKGIQVAGTTSLNQSYANGFAVNQGILEVLNGGTIKNAVTGVITGTYTAGQIDINSKGGVISCANANFINNKKDVEFLPYSVSNKSQFNNCAFITNTLLLGGVVPEAHVKMSWVSNIVFRGCNFNYAAGTTYPVGSHGYGIYSADARYSVDAFCTAGQAPCASYTRGKFQNLNTGIRSTATNPLNSATVQKNDFTNNAYDGAYFSGMNYITFVNNSMTSVGSSGLYLNNCKLYSVQNNTITGTGVIGFSNHGIIANNSLGGGNHLINRNIINNCDVAIAAQNNNAISTIGLKIKCNTMGTTIQNQYDVVMLGTNPSVDFTQGFPPNNPTPAELAKLVGNIYNATCNSNWGTRWQVDPSGQNQVYHVNNSDAFCKVIPQPSCSNVQVLPTNYPALYVSTQCPDKYPTPKNPNDLNGGISNGKMALGSAQDNQSSVIDGGNSAGLLSTVNGNGSSTSILTALQANSPYLSDAVLTAYFNKTSIPDNDIIDIHEKNKPVTSTVWQVLQNRGFSNSIMTTLNDQQNSKPVSARRMLEMNVDEANYVLNMAYCDKISYFLNDSINNSMDTALATLNAANFSDIKCQLIAAQIALPNSTITATVIDDLHGGASHVDPFCQFQKLAITANQSSEKWAVMQSNSSLKTAVEVIANDENNPAFNIARGPLEYIFETNYEHPYLMPLQGSGSRLSHAEASENDAENTTVLLPGNRSLQVYPNPTSGEVNILIKGVDEEDINQYQLEIRNTIRQMVFSKTIEGNTVNQISTRDFPNGLYMLKLLQNNSTLKESKLIIMK